MNNIIDLENYRRRASSCPVGDLDELLHLMETLQDHQVLVVFSRGDHLLYTVFPITRFQVEVE